MKTIKSERVIPIDCDDTLVMHHFDEGELDLINVVDTLHDNQHIIMRPNRAMIRLLKEEKSRGAFIIVWSRGGHAWADAIIEALGLKDYVDLCLSKPQVYFDDKDVSEWLKDRVYLSPDVKYKSLTTKTKNSIV